MYMSSQSLAANVFAHTTVVVTDGVSLLIKLLQTEDADIHAAAIHALSVVTTANDYNCRSVDNV